MLPDVVVAARALADTLERENAALAALDLAGATRLLGEKTAAAAAFSRAVQHAHDGGGIAAERRQLAVQAGRRLRELGEENRRLLERAIFVQGRVLATIAKALPKLLAPSPRYGARGILASARRVQAMTLSARV